MKDKAVRIAKVSTVPFFVVTQLSSQLDELVGRGYEVTVIASDDPYAQPLKAHRGLRFIAVTIPRKISVLEDLRGLLALWRVFRRERFDIVHSTTPKAGLLCAVAARLAGVPIRLHTYTGQPWVGMSGPKNWIARFCDRLIGRLNTMCYADSASQVEFLIAHGIVRRERIAVIGVGSLAGVDLDRFDPDRFPAETRAALRSKLGIPPSASVVLFAGRVTRDKGVAELEHAFEMLLDRGLDAYLVVIGPFEPDAESIFPSASGHGRADRVKVLGFCPEPEAYMAIADVFCLPSYREGFGTVVIEAAAMGLPAVGTGIYGLCDSIVDGKTGLLVAPRDARALFEALYRVVSDERLRSSMGENARTRACNEFSSKVINGLMVDEYARLVSSRGGPAKRVVG